MEEIEKIRNQLKLAGNSEKAVQVKKYLKSPYEFYGIAVPQLRKIAKNYKTLGKYDVYNLFDELWKSGNHEEMSLAMFIISSCKLYDLETWQFLMKRIEKAKTWDHVDWISTDILGTIVANNINLISEIKQMAESRNPWLRRASIVSTYKLIKQNKFELTLRLAEKLVYDENTYVQKGAGWMLRELGKKNRLALREFILMHKDMKPFALSYSTEKMIELREIIKKWKKEQKNHSNSNIAL